MVAKAGGAYDVGKMREAVRAGRVEWRKHVLIQLLRRNLSLEAVIQVIQSAEVIDHYPDDKPFPSALLFGWISGKPIHVVVAFDESERYAYIVTAYEPDEEHFQSDYKTRKRPK